MFFLFSKVLVVFFSPFFWVCVLFFLGLISKKANRKRNYLITGFLIMYIFSNSFLLNEVLRLWEIPPVTLNKVKRSDYAVVLGGFSNYDTIYHKTRLNVSGDRIWQTLQLYEQKKVSRIFVTSGSGKLLHQDETEADKVKDCLLLMNIPEKAIIIDMTSRNTHENAVNTSAWLKRYDPGASCILVTSALHMRRAIGCFKKSGINFIPYSADWKTEHRSYDFDNLVIPHPDTLVEWDAIIKEMIGYISYFIMGYL